MYNVDWSNVLRFSMPPRLFKNPLVAWLSVIIQSVQSIHTRFLSFVQSTRYNLSHNGQVCYLTAALNDLFDPVLRRIRIEDAGGNEIVPLHPDADIKPVSLQPDSISAINLQPDSGYTGGSYDFIVYLPYRYSDGEVFRIKSLLDYYRLAGKRYDLIF